MHAESGRSVVTERAKAPPRRQDDREKLLARSLAVLAWKTRFERGNEETMEEDEWNEDEGEEEEKRRRRERMARLVERVNGRDVT